MPWYIHVNQNVIKSNRKNNKNDKVFRVQYGKYGKPKYAWSVEMEKALSVSSWDEKPLLPCGARVVMMTNHEPLLDGVYFGDA